MIEVVAISGGKDSTAMVLRLEEIELADRVYLITPTGDELPPMAEHWERLECMLGKKLIRPPAPTLRELIDEQNALPNWRMRWCTRMIKIEPCIEWIRQQSEPVRLCVGLRADEEFRQGLYSDDVENRYPLREWGWGIDQVVGYLRERGIVVPPRTDCARCFYQRLGEWFRLWRDYPEIYASAEQDEIKTGHTYRSPTKDKHPVALVDLRERFNQGWVPRGGHVQQDLFEGEREQCRICRM